MRADMFKKYKPWINKASAHTIVDGRALILHGCAEKILRDNALDLDAVITDPPYDFDSSGGKTFGRDKSYFDKVKEAAITDGFNMNILRWLSSAPSMIVFMHNNQVAEIIYDLTLRGTRQGKTPLYDRSVMCMWHKDNPMPVANKNYVPDTELYIHAWRMPWAPQGALSEKGRFIFNPVSKSAYDHPTVKPQRVMEKCVINGSLENDIIVDPFCGSGSTGVAAVRAGRHFIGIEKDLNFYNMACERVGIALGNMKYTQEENLFNVS